MKKIIILSFAIILIHVCANAQSVTDTLEKGMSYEELKGLYNPAEYIKDVYDPYNPVLYGVCSFFIPGLGQILEEETMRGLSFLGAAVGCGVVAGIGSSMALNSAINGNGVVGLVGNLLEVAGGLGVLAIDIYAIVDALKVAKVKNMYNQDLRRLGYNGVDFKLTPSLAYVNTPSGIAPSAGLSLTVKF